MGAHTTVIEIGRLQAGYAALRVIGGGMSIEHGAGEHHTRGRRRSCPQVGRAWTDREDVTHRRMKNMRHYAHGGLRGTSLRSRTG